MSDYHKWLPRNTFFHLILINAERQCVRQLLSSQIMISEDHMNRIIKVHLGSKGGGRESEKKNLFNYIVEKVGFQVVGDPIPHVTIKNCKQTKFTTTL